MCISIDFKKAFDTLEHTILLQTIYRYGIRGMIPNGSIIIFQIQRSQKSMETQIHVLVITSKIPPFVILLNIITLLHTKYQTCSSHTVEIIAINMT